MTVFITIMLLIVLVLGGLGIYATIRNIATDDLSEVRYMLKCAKERQRIIPADNEELMNAAKEEVEELEKKYRNHWGWKFAGNMNGAFDYIPTPGEEPNEIARCVATRRVLEAKYRN